MAKNILIIGGTRNIGYGLANRLLAPPHHLTLLNRGITPDDLPDHIHRLRCDRTDPQQIKRALAGREFDVVVDMTLYKEPEAETIINQLDGRVGHYIFIGTGQVYLLRKDIQRPFKEEDYHGELIDAPKVNTYDYEEWLYGMEKRQVEDMMQNAHAERQFPMTALRLPMVNSERDGFKRLLNYILRIRDGGAILVPDKPDLLLRHVYSGDVVTAIMHLIEGEQGQGRAYNISQDETVSLYDFLHLLGDVMGRSVTIQSMPRDVLDKQGFLPDCSPFSDVWMSELDNSRSKTELGMQYTPLRTYLEQIIRYFHDRSVKEPRGYRRRRAEKKLVTPESTNE
jgi:nucleoside-diphosphate-sugar epimerase